MGLVGWGRVEIRIALAFVPDTEEFEVITRVESAVLLSFYANILF